MLTEVMIEKSSREFVELENQFGAHNYHPLDIVIERAEGVWVYDVEGNRYLDCLAAYSAVNQGHCHPRILQTLMEQAHKVTLTSRAFRNDQLGPFYKELHELTGFDMALPMNSGAEAVETAVKTARKWGYEVKGIPDGKAEIRAVTIGEVYGRFIIIKEGLKLGEKVIVEGFQKVRQGIPVSAKPYTDSLKTEETQDASEKKSSTGQS